VRYLGILRGSAVVLCSAGVVELGFPQPPGADRAGRLEAYFERNGVPLAQYAQEFVTAADQSGLDWRLLPVIALVESGGRVYRHNNIFGWASGRARFESVPQAIRHVAQHLAVAAPYAGRDLRGKLRAFNPANRWYPDYILKKMRDVAPDGAPR